MSPLFAFFGMPGPVELIIVLAIMLILFGNRLPSVMRSLGQGITEFKKGIRDDESAKPASLSQHKHDEL